jgi:hypothetical protein
MMKTTLALMSVLCASLILISCENFPYKPQQFIAPKLPPPVNAFVSKDTLAAFLGISNPKVKFVYTLVPTASSQTVYFVDFSDSAIAPKELKKDPARADWDAYTPIISPDGALVTYYLISGAHAAVYCQPLDSGAQAILIADPGSEPHFYKDNQGSLFVTYNDTNGLPLDGTPSSITGYHTYKQQVDPVSGQKIGSPAVIADFPFYGGMSKDGQYICTAYDNAYIYNLTTKNFFGINTPNPLPHQTCNPSMTPDSLHTGQMMFLNIGGLENLNQLPAGLAVKVLEHEVVFIADTNNNYVNGFKIETVLPAYSSGEWQCPKWTNKPDFFCALATKSKTSATIVYDCFLVSISTGKTLLLNTKSNLLQFDSASKPYVFIGGN